MNNNLTPDSTPAATSAATTDVTTESVAATATNPATTLATTSRRWFQHPAAVAAAAVTATLLVVGSTVAITLQVADDNDSDRFLVSSNGDGSAPAMPNGTLSPTSVSDALAFDAVTLKRVIDSAVSAVSGLGASSVTIDEGVYEVDVLLPNGGEIDVYVAADGAITVDEVADPNPSDGLANDPAIDTSRLAAVLDAARAAVTASVGDGGMVTELSTTSAPGRAYEIKIVLPRGNDISVELADNLTVIELDLD